MKLNIKSFALTCAIVWGFGLFLMTWWLIAFGVGPDEFAFVGKVYRGYSVSAVGSFIGLAWALVDGLIGGAIFAWLYNLISVRLPV